MPLYGYICESCGHEFDVFVKSFNHKDTDTACEVCGKHKCKKQLSLPMIQVAPDQPDRYERKEADHKKKVKDPERARKIRKAKFGTEGISITKSPFYHKQKQVKAQGASDVNKRDFVKAAAQNPNALAAAKKILGKK